MSTLKLLCFVLLLAGAVFLPGCSKECSKASDCAPSEYCRDAICVDTFSPFFDKVCQVDLDCDGNGDGQTEFFCELGRCRLRNTMPVMIPDSGTSTTGSDN